MGTLIFFIMQPLAERLRPSCLDDYVGQEHLVSQGAVLRTMIDSGLLSSFILWGPPGVGKTTLARIISHTLDRTFFTLSAVHSGVKEVRETLTRAKSHLFSQQTPILFIDEIHRFSKSQQDSLLGAVEEGTVILIGATTENPSFEVISPLLSRCQVYVLKALEKEALEALAHKALTQDDLLKSRKMVLEETEALIGYSGGDARKLLNLLEIVVNSLPHTEYNITDKVVTEAAQERFVMYDKGGELHYDIISAFIKSVRGSHPQAALYWLARMIEGGEDPLFICRRLVILAAEDIGLANPNAILLANACFDTVHKIGMPEGQIPMAETAVYLATSPKSNSAYAAIKAAREAVRRTGNLPVPLHLRNAVTGLMKDLDYGKGYKYAHQYENNFSEQEYLPEELREEMFYVAGNNKCENEIRERLVKWWKK